MDQRDGDRYPSDTHGDWLSGSCAESPTGIAERTLMRPHIAIRPSWCCSADGDPWPCLVARVTLRHHLTDETLREVMATFAHEAIQDMHLDLETYNRFYAWINEDPTAGITRAIGCAPIPRFQPPTAGR